MTGLVLATVRDQIAGYVDALCLVYTILVFAYVVASLFFGVGGRVSYSRWSDAIFTFLRDVCEPYLRIFRRFLPMVGPLDLSPFVGILVLQLGCRLVVGLVAG